MAIDAGLIQFCDQALAIDAVDERDYGQGAGDFVALEMAY